MIHLSTLEPRLTMAKAEQISSTSEGFGDIFSCPLHGDVGAGQSGCWCC